MTIRQLQHAERPISQEVKTIRQLQHAECPISQEVQTIKFMTLSTVKQMKYNEICFSFWKWRFFWEINSIPDLTWFLC